MILLTDHLDNNTDLLVTSLKTAGADCTVISSSYDGFLPEGVISPYGYLLYGKDLPERKPRFFDQLDVPGCWEIRSSLRSGEVIDLDQRKARIYYAEPKEKRLIKIVDWLDRDGKVRVSDHYDAFGNRFAQTVLNEKEKPLIKTYFTPDGREKIVENLETGSIFVSEEAGYRIFKDKVSFVIWFLELAEISLESFALNSLGLPFKVSQELAARGTAGEDILFWQEKIKDRIPGNMQTIFKDKAPRIKKVLIQDMDSLEKLQENPEAAPAEKYAGLGYIYHFEKENRGEAKILICTNSDQVEHLEELAKDVPEFTIFVAALTEMSSKLMDLAKYPNVKLFPNAKTKKLEELFMEADYYLDINHGNEISNALEKAYLHNLIIIAFEETVHSRRYVAPELICGIDEYRILVNTLKLVLTDNDFRQELIDLQYEHAMLATAEEYRENLGI